MAGPVAGLSVAAPTAVGWVTDFLNAASYARRDPDPADLRLALGVLTTRWARTGRRLGARDLPVFVGAFTADRLRGRGTLDREALLRGGARLLGPWFPEAWDDPRRRAHGIAFETVAARRAFDPGVRVVDSALGELTPPERAPEDREWSTYEPVALPDPDAALALLRDPARWPDIASEAGRFTALRRGALGVGQTFEIELLAVPLPRVPLLLRSYVSVTSLHLRPGRPLDAAARALPGGLPEGAAPRAFIALTTHAGHVLGRAISHLLVFEDETGAYVRDVGCWDPLPTALKAAYLAGGRAAQHAFWSPEPERASMLAQLARVTSPGGG